LAREHEKVGQRTREGWPENTRRLAREHEKVGQRKGDDPAEKFRKIADSVFVMAV